jgi:hypothetical protein
MPFSESLTVRILGDSSQLRSELSQTVVQLQSLQERVNGLTTAGQQIGQSFSRLEGAMRPLQQLSQLLTQVTGQIRALSQQPVTLDVQPAMQALQALIQAIEAAIARLRMLGAVKAAVPGAGGGGGGPAVRLAAGGYVVGPPGADRVPAMLTAGEFVLSREATLALGAGFLGSLNTGSNPSSARAAATTSSTTNNQIGDLHIHVQQTADVNSLVRDLRFQGIQLRNRRG